MITGSKKKSLTTPMLNKSYIIHFEKGQILKCKLAVSMILKEVQKAKDKHFSSKISYL
jgi:hypothetical protein